MATLTDQIIRKMEPPEKGRRLVFDEHQKAPRGFGIKITHAGTRTFVFRYKLNGRDRLMNIGGHPAITLAAARKLAVAMRLKVDGGDDILAERRRKATEDTVADIVERYCRQVGDKLKSGKDVRGSLERHIIPALGGIKAKELRRAEVIKVIDQLADRAPRQAGLTLGHFKRVMAWAEDREAIEINPVASLRASKINKRMVSQVRRRVLSESEIATLWNMREPPVGMTGIMLLVLQFILVTGQRPGEVVQAKWAEVKGRTWTIPAAHRGKTNDDHRVHLTDSAMMILERAGGGTAHLFQHGRSGITENALPRAVRRCWAAFGDDPDDRWRPHDLRRTMRTGLAAAGIPESIAEKAVGHTQKGIVAVYDQHRYDAEKQTAMEAWERRLQRIASGKSDDNVVAVAFK